MHFLLNATAAFLRTTSHELLITTYSVQLKGR